MPEACPYKRVKVERTDRNPIGSINMINTIIPIIPINTTHYYIGNPAPVWVPDF